jgi:nucleotide-binding universal stress UspA family protein
MIERVLVALDGPEHADKAMDLACEMAGVGGRRAATPDEGGVQPREHGHRQEQHRPAISPSSTAPGADRPRGSPAAPAAGRAARRRRRRRASLARR